MTLARPELNVQEIVAASRRADVVAAVEELYARLAHDIDARGPTCWNRALCCNFARYGHRLYVTSLELAYYLARGPLPALPAIAPLTCPHARDSICHAREARPLGCRIFYCDPAAQDWQGPVTEAYLQELRRLHEEFGLSYAYVEWTGALAALDAALP